MTVHWCGAGLSAIPGLRRLIKDGYDVVVWNRTLEKATEAVGDITNSIRVFEKGSLQDCLKENDIIINVHCYGINNTRDTKGRLGKV